MFILLSLCHPLWYDLQMMKATPFIPRAGAAGLYNLRLCSSTRGFI